MQQLRPPAAGVPQLLQSWSCEQLDGHEFPPLELPLLLPPPPLLLPVCDPRELPPDPSPDPIPAPESSKVTPVPGPRPLSVGVLVPHARPRRPRAMNDADALRCADRPIGQIPLARPTATERLRS
jgi:hypothetical protein